MSVKIKNVFAGLFSPTVCSDILEEDLKDIIQTLEMTMKIVIIFALTVMVKCAEIGKCKIGQIRSH